MREPEDHLLDEDGKAPLPEWRRPEARPPVTQVATDHPVTVYPGRCQVCQQVTDVRQRWPKTLPARFVELCRDCQKLSDAEIARKLPPWRHDGASV